MAPTSTSSPTATASRSRQRAEDVADEEVAALVDVLVLVDDPTEVQPAGGEVAVGGLEALDQRAAGAAAPARSPAPRRGCRWRAVTTIGLADRAAALADDRGGGDAAAAARRRRRRRRARRRRARGGCRPGPRAAEARPPTTVTSGRLLGEAVEHLVGGEA